MEMYFAVDQIAPNFTDELLHAFELAKRHNGKLSLYALIDTSFEYANPRAGRPIWKGQEASLYQGSGLDALLNASPCLFKLADDENLARVQMRRLLDHCSGKPMLSFIASEFDSSALVQTFKDFLEVKSVDKQQFVLRFADARILAGLDSILQGNNTYGWRRGIAHWWLPNRQGRLSQLPDHACNEDDNARTITGLALSQDAFNQLVDDGETDAVLDAIFDQNPAVLEEALPSENYFLVQRLLAQTARFEIKNFPDVVMFCTTALFTSEYFYSHPRFKEVLGLKAWPAGELGTALYAIDDACWAEAELMSSDK